MKPFCYIFIADIYAAFDFLLLRRRPLSRQPPLTPPPPLLSAFTPLAFHYFQIRFQPIFQLFFHFFLFLRRFRHDITFVFS